MLKSSFCWGGDPMNRPRTRHTAGRCVFVPYGYEGSEFVSQGNVLAVRAILLCVLASFLGLRWLLEQPSGSSFEDLPEFQLLLRVAEVIW